VKYWDNYIYIYSNNKLQKIPLQKKILWFVLGKKTTYNPYSKSKCIDSFELIWTYQVHSISGFSHDTLRGTMVVYLGLPDLTILFKIHMPVVQIMKNHSVMEHARYWPLRLFHSLFRHTAAAGAHPSSSLVPHSQGTIACSQHIPQYTYPIALAVWVEVYYFQKTWNLRNKFQRTKICEGKCLNLKNILFVRMKVSKIN
jgi:hypothetical protein